MAYQERQTKNYSQTGARGIGRDHEVDSFDDRFESDFKRYGRNSEQNSVYPSEADEERRYRSSRNNREHKYFGHGRSDFDRSDYDRSFGHSDNISTSQRGSDYDRSMSYERDHYDQYSDRARGDWGMKSNGFGNRYSEGRGLHSTSEHEQMGSRYANQRGEHYGKGPKGWKFSDERIKEDACHALYRDSHVDASEIDVTVKDGCVCLRGSVESREAKRHAEECVENLTGVEDVQNELRVNREANNMASINRQTSTTSSGGKSTGAQPKLS